jgi:acyl-CoA thioesterase-1
MRSCLLSWALGTLVIACGGETRQADPATTPAAPDGRLQAAAAPTPVRAASGPRVVFLGDSLTAGYGLEEGQAFPALVARQLAEAGTPIQAINAGVSGDTSAGGLARLSWLLRQRPDLLVVELGANDALRGQAPEATERNLRQIVERARSEGVEVLLIGMLAPPNYGPEFTREFGAIYPRLARQLDVPLVPFLLAGVAGRPELNLPDGMHPTAEGHAVLARTLLPHLREALGRLPRRAAAPAP